MSIHINAAKGDIAPIVLLPGDPLRAKYIAETFLEDAVCYNEVRGMYGYTGTYQGVRISVQGTGMGIPSAMIYMQELIQSYDVEVLIRIGTCGGIREEIKVRDILIPQAAATNANFITNGFGIYNYPPIGDFDLIRKAVTIGEAEGLNIRVGSVVSDDLFYKDGQVLTDFQKIVEFGALGVEMEAAGLYYLAAKFQKKALAILTVSDHLVTGEETTAEERQTTFNDMIRLALKTAIEA